MDRLFQNFPHYQNLRGIKLQKIAISYYTCWKRFLVFLKLISAICHISIISKSPNSTVGAHDKF